MFEIEVKVLERTTLGELEVERACRMALEEAGVPDGHLAVSFVDGDEIRRLNKRYRNTDRYTDVLAFPVDESEVVAGPRELGDMVVCPEYADEQLEAVVHGALHLAGMDHEKDSGEMLEMQHRIVERLKPAT